MDNMGCDSCNRKMNYAVSIPGKRKNCNECLEEFCMRHLNILGKRGETIDNMYTWRSGE